MIGYNSSFFNIRKLIILRSMRAHVLVVAFFAVASVSVYRFTTFGTGCFSHDFNILKNVEQCNRYCAP